MLPLLFIQAPTTACRATCHQKGAQIDCQYGIRYSTDIPYMVSEPYLESQGGPKLNFGGLYILYTQQ